MEKVLRRDKIPFGSVVAITAKRRPKPAKVLQQLIYAMWWAGVKSQVKSIKRRATTAVTVDSFWIGQISHDVDSTIAA